MTLIEEIDQIGRENAIIDLLPAGAFEGDEEPGPVSDERLEELAFCLYRDLPLEITDDECFHLFGKQSVTDRRLLRGVFYVMDDGELVVVEYRSAAHW